MRKKIVLFLMILVLSLTMVFAEDAPWWTGKEITGFDVNGLDKVSSTDVNSALYPFRGEIFSEKALYDMETKLFGIDGIATIAAGVTPTENGDLRVVFTVTEMPIVNEISVEGNTKVKKGDILGVIKNIEEGSFFDVDSKLILEQEKANIKTLYFGRGFEEVPVEAQIITNEDKTINIVFSVTEGTQSRITAIEFEGNTQVSDSVLKKQIKSKSQSLLSRGYLDVTQVATDKILIMSYYQTLGYVDVIVTSKVDTNENQPNPEIRDVTLTYIVDEGKQWFFGGLNVAGNTIYSDEEIANLLTLEQGKVLNYNTLQSDYTAVVDLYYDNGYISNGMNLSENRDDINMTISYDLRITEGPQATVEKIILTGLTSTEEYVMRRELEIHEGDIFSKSKLIVSAQNLYNTGLLSNLDYDIYMGESENGIIVEFVMEEGSHMDIQFGATFGGNVGGFPISGFLQWSDHNLGGRGQELNVSTNLSPDSQDVAVSFGDNWVGDKRWANSVSLGFTHTVNKNVLQAYNKDKAYQEGKKYDGTNLGYPLGFDSYDDYLKKSAVVPPLGQTMTYDLLTATLGYSTGYTFIYDIGRLSATGGLSLSLNKAIYDDKQFVPFNPIISKYHDGEGGFFNTGWQFSNKITLGLQWDGRDYTINTTKGYVVSGSITYAGGYLGGLSNYKKLSLSGAAYQKIAELGKEDAKKNLMASFSSNASFMLGQTWTKDGKRAYYRPIEGATPSEMLSIDGMTMARGHSYRINLEYVWDNMLEFSYPLVDNILNAEAFASATIGGQDLTKAFKEENSEVLLAAGLGVKLKISGFPLGLYLVKDATAPLTNITRITPAAGTLPGGLKFVVAISTSLI